MTTLSRLLAMVEQIDAMLDEGCAEAMERIERERPVTRIDIGLHNADMLLKSRRPENQVLAFTRALFRYPERIQVDRLEVHP